MRTLGVFAVLSFMALAAMGENPASERMQVTLVEVPVTVTTAGGEPVRGLTKENFALYDDGHPREITHFDVIDFAARAAQPKAQQMLASGAARRNFMVLFDLGNADPISLLRARDAALQFIDKQILPGDRLAVATISPMRGFELQATFSTDRQLARHAVKTFGLPKLRMASDPLRITTNQQPRGEGFSEEASEGASDQEALTELAEEAYERLSVLRQLREYAALGRVLDRVAGRKEVILLSEGFGAHVVQGRPANAGQQRAQSAALETGQIWQVNNDQRFGSTEAKTALQGMIDALRRSDVVLNAIDIKGLRGTIDARFGNVTSSNDALHLLTRETGGRVFKNDNDLKGDFARMLKAREVTYILAFERSGGDDDRFHRLKVKVVNVPGARVNHRVGYYENATNTTDFERLLTAGEIMVNSLPVDDVKIAATAIPFLSASAQADVRVIVQVDGKSLLGNAKGPMLSTEFFIYAFDDQEMVRDFTYQKVELDLSKTRDRLANRGVKFCGALHLPSGDYSIRTLVRQGARNGFVSVPLHVPAAGEPAAAIALNDPEDWLLVMGSARGDAQPYPFELGELTIIPAVSPVLPPGSFDVAVMMYGLSVSNLNVTAHVDGPPGITQDAALSLVGRTATDAAGGIKLLFRFTPPALSHGDYSLVLDLRDENAGKEQHATLPFRFE